MAFHRNAAFDALPIGKAMDLLLRLNKEEYTPDLFPEADPEIRTGNSILCATDDHVRSTTRSFTPSLSVRQVKGMPVGVRCFGSCSHGAPGASGLSEYLAKVGPILEDEPGKGRHAADYYFFSHEGGQINRILKEMDAGTSFSIGYLDWKKTRKLAAEGAGESKVYQLKEKVVNALRYTIDDLLAEGSHLGVLDKEALEIVCQARGWKPDVVTEIVLEGKLGLETAHGKNDVRMTFAVSGLLPSPTGSLARAVKGRLLVEKQIMWVVKPSGTKTPLLSDFTALGLWPEKVPVYICEGEPDAISLRHLHPKAIILAVCGLANYVTPEVLELVPNLPLNGRHVVLCLDRDRTKTPEGVDTWKQVRRNSAKEVIGTVYDTFVAALITNHSGMASLTAWMPPQEAGKDVNDWLKTGKGGFRRADGRLIYQPGHDLSAKERAAKVVDILDSYLPKKGEA
jgi:hypothetical protein